MELQRTTNDRLKFGFIVFTVLISIHIWSFQAVPQPVYIILEALLIGCQILIVLYHHFVLRKKLLFKSNVFFFILIPYLLSAFGAYAFHDQALSLSYLISRLHLLWLFYFVLHIFDIPKERIIQFMNFVGIVWAFLTIVQQFTYPTYYFYSLEESDTYSIYRGGVYRFMVEGALYGTFFLLYYFYQYLTTNKFKYGLWVLLGLVGFYSFGTRQSAIAVAGCMLLATILVKGKAQLNAVLSLLIAVPLLFVFKETLFGSYIEMTNEQFKYGDNVRQLGAKFWMFEYWPNHWAAKITGNGPNHMLSKYGQEMELIRSYYHFYRSDVGIIGAYNQYGILYALNILLVNYKGLKNRYYTKSNKYLKLIFINALIVLITNQAYSHINGIPFWCLMFFLVEKSYEEKKEEEEALNEEAPDEEAVAVSN